MKRIFNILNLTIWSYEFFPKILECYKNSKIKNVISQKRNYVTKFTKWFDKKIPRNSKMKKLEKIDYFQ